MRGAVRAIRQRPDAAVVAAAAWVAAAISLPVVWLGPLNVDEEVTLTIATRPVAEILDVVWRERGGGPAHFLLEHLTLRWPGGLEGLRLPSLAFLVLALPAVALLGRELAGPGAARVAVAVVSVAPLAVSYATFGRPHTLLLASSAWASWVALRAARAGSRRRWAVAGVLLGALVYVHPIAPLYLALAFAAALLHADLAPRRLVATAWPGAAALAATAAPYFVNTLAVVKDRYGVGEGRAGRTFTGEPVWEEALRALAPGRPLVGLPLLLAAVGLAAVAARRPRSAVVLGATIAVPVAFFSAVPTGAASGVFFGRYLLPALPAFAILVAAGCLAIGRVAGAPVAAVLVGGVLALQLWVVASRRAELDDLRLDAVEKAVEPYAGRAVLFRSTGTVGERGEIGALTRGRPPTLLSRYLELELPALAVVDDRSCSRVRPFLARAARPSRGLWLFYAGPGADRARGARAVSAVAGTARIRAGGPYVLVGSLDALPPRALVRLGARVRSAWAAAIPADVAAAAMAAEAREALGRGRCVA